MASGLILIMAMNRSCQVGCWMQFQLNSLTMIRADNSKNGTDSGKMSGGVTNQGAGEIFKEGRGVIWANGLAKKAL